MNADEGEAQTDRPQRRDGGEEGREKSERS